jgi:hypothetical protein
MALARARGRMEGYPVRASIFVSNEEAGRCRRDEGEEVRYKTAVNCHWAGAICV